jgi:putative transposase
MRVSRSTLHYVPSLPVKHGPVVAAMQRLSRQYPRYGARRIRIFLSREGIDVGSDKCRRLWSDHDLQVPSERSRKRVAGSRPRPLAPAMANSVWSYDFVFDACANGQHIKRARCATLSSQR